MHPLPPIDPLKSTILHRFTVKPRHLEQWLALWPEEARLRRRAGYRLHRLFVETDAEPKVTLLCSHDDPIQGMQVFMRSSVRLAEAMAPHTFRNVVTRTVRPELITEATRASITGRIAIMRRYAITGSWADFLDLWARMLPVRQRYGFNGLFAVSDEAHDLFTWAFDFAGNWEDLADAQKAYHRDPERMALRGIFDHLADYSIHPARQILV